MQSGLKNPQVSVYVAVLTFVPMVFCPIQHILEALYHSFREDCHKHLSRTPTRQLFSVFLCNLEGDDITWKRSIEEFELQWHSCANNVQHCLCDWYTPMRHSKQTATLLLTFDIFFDLRLSAQNNRHACRSPFGGQRSKMYTYPIDNLFSLSFELGVQWGPSSALMPQWLKSFL